MRSSVMLVGAVLALAATGCSSGDDSGTSGSSSRSSSGECGSMDGKKGVVRSFCGGSAKMVFDIGTTHGEIGGGTCETDAGYFVLNAGTVISQDFEGTKPDYAGFILPTTTGDIDSGDATVTITYGGQATIVSDVTGTRDESSGEFSGTALDSGDKVTGSWTC